MVTENAIGVISARFQVLTKPIALHPHQASNVVMACALLHNFLRKSDSSTSIYTPSGFLDTVAGGEIIPGSWRKEIGDDETALKPLHPCKANFTLSAVKVRNNFAQYYNSH